jgi:hypothetical protein
MDSARRAASVLARRRWDGLSAEQRAASTAPAREALAEKRRQNKGNIMANATTSAWSDDVASFARGGAATEKDNAHLPLHTPEPEGNSASTGQNRDLNDPWGGLAMGHTDMGTTDHAGHDRPVFPGDDGYHAPRLNPFGVPPRIRQAGQK